MSLLIDILGNMSIAVNYCPICANINFKIELSFLMNTIFYITKKSGQKFKYLKKEKSL